MHIIVQTKDYGTIQSREFETMTREKAEDFLTEVLKGNYEQISFEFEFHKVYLPKQVLATSIFTLMY